MHIFLEFSTNIDFNVIINIKINILPTVYAEISLFDPLFIKDVTL